jgi:hypothetical protein
VKLSVKVHIVQGTEILAICDRELIGKRIDNFGMGAMQILLEKKQFPWL